MHRSPASGDPLPLSASWGFKGRDDRRVALAGLTRFGSNPGALKAWLHVPASLRPGTALVVTAPIATSQQSAPADLTLVQERSWFDGPARVIDDALRAAVLVR